MADWGEIMCRYYGRTSFARDTDVTVNYLGYYTDNGKYKFQSDSTLKRGIMYMYVLCRACTKPCL